MSTKWQSVSLIALAIGVMALIGAAVWETHTHNAVVIHKEAAAYASGGTKSGPPEFWTEGEHYNLLCNDTMRSITFSTSRPLKVTLNGERVTQENVYAQLQSIHRQIEQSKDTDRVSVETRLCSHS